MKKNLNKYILFLALITGVSSLFAMDAELSAEVDGLMARVEQRYEHLGARRGDLAAQALDHFLDEPISTARSIVRDDTPVARERKKASSSLSAGKIATWLVCTAGFFAAGWADGGRVLSLFASIVKK